MEHSCIRQTDLPNTTKLFSDFTYHPDRVSHFYPYLPCWQDNLQRIASDAELSPERRSALVAALSVQNAGSPLLEEIAKPGVVAVVTGQQVGLFSGPAYTIYKALTAIRLADRLNASGIRAVPVFWLATEDHDFAEVDHAWVYGGARKPVKLVAGASPKPNQPVGGVTVESIPLDGLRHALDGLPFADEALELVRDSYQPGRTFGEAFNALLDKILAGFPILRVDPMLPAFRTLAAPTLQAAVHQAPELTRVLLERNRELGEAGYHAQVHVEDSTSLFFLLKNGQRLALRRHNGTYFAGTQSFAGDALAANAHDLSPNALLRPVIQDSMIPTVAYVGGPAELAYLAQSEVLYRNLLGRQPAALHRAGFTLLDAHSRKLLTRYGLNVTEFFHGDQALKERAAAILVDPPVRSRVQDAQATAMKSLAQMSSAVTSFDPSILKALEKSTRKITWQFNKLERKIAREAMRRDARASHDIESLSGLIFPDHRLQERLYSFVSLYAHHGPDLVSRLHDSLAIDCPDHQVLTV
jgi:bacillithiol biosynthesis cysteine-adding enzyme BshC